MLSEGFSFSVVTTEKKIKERGFYLIEDGWDDWFEYEITYTLVIKEDSRCPIQKIGRVKIAQKGQKERKTKLNTTFEKLDESFVSVGFDERYYEELNKTPFREVILDALNDIAFKETYDSIKDDAVTRMALMRDYTEWKLKDQVHRMAMGGAKLSAYDFTYVFPNDKYKLSFAVQPDEQPSSNIHVIVGKNGTGKTTLIKNMIYALADTGNPREKGRMENIRRARFAGVVFVAFSAFDSPFIDETVNEAIQFKYVGLVNIKNRSVKSSDTLADEFVDSSFELYDSEIRIQLWQNMIKILESDSSFEENNVSEWISPERKKEWREIASRNRRSERREIIREQHRRFVRPLFSTMSSGHKIILLTIVNLINTVEEKTIVFLDEPEEHLHPPLIAAFMRALSYLLSYRNGVGIISTHSPVVVQEVPKRCVWKLRRIGNTIVPERPSVETYGENLGELTSEIFGYELEKTGFHEAMQSAAKRSRSYDEAKEVFQNELGKEARSLLRFFMYEKEHQDK